jgi:RimJ/RimL family protein N-acetyltransferase
MTYADLEKIFKIENTNIQVVPFRSYLLKIMDLHPEDLKNIQDFPDYYNHMDKASDYGYAVCVDGRPMACFGVIQLWPNVGEIWMIPDRIMLSKYKTKFHKGAFKFMLATAKQLNLHRIHCTVKANNARAIKWIEKMSFTQEGVCRQYGPDKEDYIMYARLFKHG